MEYPFAWGTPVAEAPTAALVSAELVRRAEKVKAEKAAKAEKENAERERAEAEPDCMGDVGIPRYRLTNRASNIRRLKERLALLEQTRPEAEPEKIGDVTIEESDNRVRLIFPGKPSAEARALLKRYGFRWSPSAGAWQRHATEQARYLARQALKEIGHG